jgi:hypothetical protein
MEGNFFIRNPQNLDWFSDNIRSVAFSKFREFVAKCPKFQAGSKKQYAD